MDQTGAQAQSTDRKEYFDGQRIMDVATPGSDINRRFGEIDEYEHFQESEGCSGLIVQRDDAGPETIEAKMSIRVAAVVSKAPAKMLRENVNSNRERRQRVAGRINGLPRAEKEKRNLHGLQVRHHDMAVRDRWTPGRMRSTFCG